MENSQIEMENKGCFNNQQSQKSIYLKQKIELIIINRKWDKMEFINSINIKIIKLIGAHTQKESKEMFIISDDKTDCHDIKYIKIQR